MKTINRDALYRDLIDTLVEYQYQKDNPLIGYYEQKPTHFTAIQMYQQDQLFRYKVQSLASVVMSLIDKHLEIEELTEPTSNED